MALQDPTQGMAADPATNSAPAPDDQPADASGGYCVELRVDASGKMSVGVEPLAAEQGEEGGEGEDEYQAVGSLGEAVRLIKEIVAHAGNMSDMSASQDEMSAGYGKAGA